MTKLIIQIPCLNEEEALPVTLAALPTSLPGIDVVEWLVVSDGSADGTVETAKRLGVHHVVDLRFHQGLAKAFLAGLDAALKAGADIIVNIDADNQYNADDIDKLIAPILQQRAAIVVGARPIQEIRHFSPMKKFLQRLGSKVVQILSGTDIPDAPSGFRALSREAALQLNVFSGYTYTLETIIQAGRKGIPITWVPIRVNGVLRPSRLMKNMSVYIRRNLFDILRVFMVYRPLAFFGWLGAVPFAFGTLLGMRWLWLTYVAETSRTHLPSLILASILLMVGVETWLFGLATDLGASNRQLLEEIRLRLRRQEIDGNGK